jgi:hypothetical protein
MKRFQFAVVLFFLSMSIAPAFAGDTQVNISNEANSTWCGEPYNQPINCSTFPTGSQTYNGVGFDIPTSNNAWFADVAAQGQSGQVSVKIPVNVKNVKTAYTLMNTLWGSKTKDLLTITFTGTGGASWTYEIIEGSDTRDYNNGNYLNTIDCRLPSIPTKTLGKTGSVSAFTNKKGQRLDMQMFELPTSFAGQTLVSVTITDNGGPEVQRSFLAAMTVSTSAP